jgi:hypothetical protein
MTISEEISDEDYSLYRSIMEKAKDVFINGMQVMNSVIMYVPTADIIWTTKLNLELSKLWEQRDEYKLATQCLRQTLNRIIARRNEILERGVESQRDLFLPFSLTCSNLKIEQMIKKMKEKYIEAKNTLNVHIRQNDRRRNRKEQNKNPKELELDEQRE